jgi:hypothetical protein
MGNAGIFDDLLEDFTAICHSLWLFGIVCGYLVYLCIPFGYICTKKNLATLASVACSGSIALMTQNNGTDIQDPISTKLRKVVYI